MSKITGIARIKKRSVLLLAAVMLLGILTACGQTAVSGSSSANTAPAASAGEPAAPAEPAAPVEPEKMEGDEFGNGAVGTKAAVTSPNIYISNVGMEILKKGGNAIDAATAMIYALSLTEPGGSTLGGAGFMNIYLKDTKENHIIEYLETAPGAAAPGVLDVNDANEKEGAKSVCVPGQVHGTLTALEKYGTMNREEVLAPAIKLAEEGFKVHISFEERATGAFDKLSKYDEAVKIYTNEGIPYAIGDLYKNQDYADTLKKLAAGGIDEFYKGGVAKAIVDEVQRLGGILTMEDMASYTSVIREPVSTTYHGYEVVTTDAPSNGGVPMLEMLNILENYDLKAMGNNSAEYLYTFNEAFRLSMADGIQYFGDPDFYDLPVEEMISKDYAKKRMESMPKDGKINDSLVIGQLMVHESPSTTQICVIDELGNMVSTTNTIGTYFGSGIVAPGTGFALNSHLNNMLHDEKDKDNTNYVKPGKRIMSTMCPTLVLKDGESVMAIGSPGSWAIPPAIAMVINDMVLFDLNIQQSINLPRALCMSKTAPWTMSAESRLSAEALKGLADYGYTVKSDKEWDSGLGSVAGIYLDKVSGKIYAGGDNRRQYQSLAY